MNVSVTTREPATTDVAATIRVTVLYPDRLNLYADRGNLLVLAQRCRRRGIGFELTRVTIGDSLVADRIDLLYLGGGQDRDQRACAADLLRHRETVAALVAGGATVLGICGGYQLLGHEYVTPDGTIPGLGLLDVVTRREDGPRLVGNAAVSIAAATANTATITGGSGADERMLVGFENHQGRTTLGASARPLGRVLAGHGNNGSDGTEGAIADHDGPGRGETGRGGRVIGTYLHGPLLAKNVWFADELIAGALGVASTALDALDDAFADAVHARARVVALGVNDSPA